MYCTSCGNLIKKNYNFCTNCGKKNAFLFVNNKQQNLIKNKKISYFKKHWYGQLTLGISYWINNVLLYIIFTFLIIFFAKNMDFTNDFVLPSIFMVIIWIVVSVLIPWSLIGLWRSTKNHIDKYNITFSANIVRIFVVLGWIQAISLFINTGVPQIIEFSKIAFSKDDIPTYNIRILNNGKELEISNGIEFGLTNEIKKYFDKYPNIKVLHLNSMGGRIAEAQKLSNFLKDKNIITYTSRGCYSACIDIFMAGKYRFINENADLGFHQPAFAGMTKNNLIEAIYQQKQYYLSKGVEKAFIEKAFSTPYNDIWKPSHFELKQAGIIDKVVDGNDYVATELYFWNDLKKLESLLLRIPLYQTIKIYAPNEFKEIINIIHSSIQHGDTKIAMFAKTRKIAQKLYLKYLPYSSNEALLNATKLMISEMQTIYKKNPIECYKFSIGELNNFNPNNYFTNDFLEYELNLMNAVIESGAVNPQKISNEKKIEKIQEKLFLLLYKAIGEDILILDKLNSKNIDKEKASRVIIIMYKKILNLKYDEKISLLRFMYSKIEG